MGIGVLGVSLTSTGAKAALFCCFRTKTGKRVATWHACHTFLPRHNTAYFCKKKKYTSIFTQKQICCQTFGHLLLPFSLLQTLAVGDMSVWVSMTTGFLGIVRNWM